ncbi:hypothetical protein A6A04_10495 [Paramagnetospirillum marisnigri]|uniref:histidine kinase n=2 Tax=Paramagnetospirillum marisnigri TaxID=1285242 RepID=A0A178MZJ8_9PROT|nr:hypothetical protein A6A04_10495 [Paramagnetospirillum marisnigri]
MFGLWIFTFHAEHRRGVEQGLNRQREVVEEQVNGVFKITETFLVAADRWVADHPGRDPRNDPSFADLVREFQRVTDQAMLVRLVAEDGSLYLVPDTPGAKAANVVDRDYFRETMKEPPGRIYISAPFQGRSTGRWAIAVAKRLSVPHHGAVIVFVAIEQGLLDSAFAKAQVGPEGAISLLRADGILLSRSATRPSDLGKDLSGSVIFTEGLPKAREGVLITTGTLTDGIPKLLSYGSLPTYPLVIAVGTSLSSVSAIAWEAGWRGVLALSVISALALLSRRQIMRLIDDLASSRQDLMVSHDRLSQEVDERRQVEVALNRTEADLRAILDNMLDVFYRTGPDGRVTIISRSVQDVLGFSQADVLGQFANDFHFDADGRERLQAALAANGGSVVDFDLRMRHKQGHPVWVATSSHLVMDHEGHFAGIEGVFRSIEERKAVEKALRNHASQIESLINASSDATMLFELDGTILAVNTVLAARFGKTPQELRGTNLWALFPPEVAEARKVATARVVETGHAVHFLDRRGELHFDNSIYPVAGADGVIDKVAVYSRDITEQTLIEERIGRYIAEIERSNAELEQFAYVASHDLREPLRMITSYLTLIERRYGTHLEGDGLEFLAFARDGATRMDRLVLDLLEYSRIDRRGDPIVSMPVVPAIRQAMQHLAVAIEESGATVTLDESCGDAMVMGDQNQIIRLFQNLIGNAIKYQHGERPPRIDLKWRLVDGVWEFSIADNGIGIEPQYFERIFGIFQRLHTRDRYEGTGIGLAVCRKIVERHGGRIWLASESGVGTTFFLTLRDAAGVPPGGE